MVQSSNNYAGPAVAKKDEFGGRFPAMRDFYDVDSAGRAKELLWHNAMREIHRRAKGAGGSEEAVGPVELGLYPDIDDIRAIMDEDSVPDMGQEQKEQAWMRKMSLLKKGSHLAGDIAALAGQKELAQALQDIGEVTEGGLKGEGSGAGANLGGRAAGRIAQRRGLGRGQSSAIGGAVAGALAGQGVVGIAENAFSWYLVDAALAGLLTFYGSIPCLLYLDFHWLMSRMGFKFFSPMLFWQKGLTIIANIVAIIIGAAVVAIIASFYNALPGNLLSA